MLDSKSDDDIPAAAAVVVAADPPLATNTIEYEDAIPKLLFVDMQQEDEEKVAAAVTELNGLLSTSNADWKVNADQALSSGVIAIIILLMRKWHYNRSIQFHGCCVLMRLACFIPEQRPNDEGKPVKFYCGQVTRSGQVTRRGAGRSWVCQLSDEQCSSCSRLQMGNPAAAVSIIKSGGIETIMAAMKSFPNDDDMQRRGCRAIGNAFHFTIPAIDKANPAIGKAMAHFVHKLNGIELVVSVMKKFQNNASVQQMCLYVLQQLSREQDLRDALKKGCALSAVGEAAEKHDDIDSIQSAATAFFKNMSS